MNRVSFNTSRSDLVIYLLICSHVLVLHWTNLGPIVP